TQIKKENPLNRLFGRFINIKNDQSALHRFNDFLVGISYMIESPYIFLFGIGYNYIQYDLNTNLTALDSSVINTIICFGIFGTSLILYVLIRMIKKTIKNISRFSTNVLPFILAYIISSIIISNFNNLLYYQFYIVYFGSFLGYFYLLNEYD
ncbi:MAG: hypothetical protein ACOWWH_13235, partial [Eubacteriaceae bacterium]